MVSNATAENITVQLDSVSFYDADSSFTIASATTANNQEIILAGFLKGGIPGEVIEATGSWRPVSKSAAKFYVDTFTKILPVTDQGICKFLNGGVVKGLDAKTAKAITQRFGTKTFDVLSGDGRELADITGITPKILRLATESWQKHLKILELTDFLHGVAVSPAFAAPIYRHFGPDALDIIKTNPYKMASKISGVSFITAAKIAKQLNLDLPPEEYVQYGLFAIMANKLRKGHTYYPYTKLVAACGKKLGLKPDLAIKAIARATAKGQLTLVDMNGANSGFVMNNKAVYLSQSYRNGMELSQRIKTHLDARLNPKLARALSLDDKSKTADPIAHKHLGHILTQKICLVDDASKKNKRVIIDSLLSLGKRAGLKTLLAVHNKKSPTFSHERYAPLRQIDELLQIDCRTGLPGYTADNQLDCDLLIVAQASLLNAEMFLRIMRALPEKATLILSGDSQHLPPPGPGRVFHDLLASGKISVCNLGDMGIDDSPLGQTARMFSRGEMPPLPEFRPFERQEMSFYFIEQETPQKIFKTISGLFGKRLPKGLGYNPLDIQIVSLAKKGPVGVKKLNIYLQNRLNKRAGGLKHNGFIYKLNDKIVQMRDDCAKGLLCGQTALITGIDMYKKELYAQTGDGRGITYIFHELYDIRPAYAVSANITMGHKFKAVIVPLHCDSYFNLDRATLYTAMLTAGEMMIIVGQPRAFKIALGNRVSQKRYTRLKNLLTSSPA